MSIATIPSAQSYQVKAVSYTVPASKSGQSYIVTCSPTDGSVLDCTCKSRTYRPSTFCRHMTLAASKDHGGLKPRVRIGPALATFATSYRPPEMTAAMRAAADLYS